jgi:hypothetical protein
LIVCKCRESGSIGDGNEDGEEENERGDRGLEEAILSPAGATFFK